MKKTIKGKLTLNTAIFIVAAIIVCEIVSVNALKTNMTNRQDNMSAERHRPMHVWLMNGCRGRQTRCIQLRIQ